MKRIYFFILTFFLFFCFLDFSFSREDDSSRADVNDETETAESSRPDDAKIDDTPSLEYDDTSGQSEDNLVEINDLNENDEEETEEKIITSSGGGGSSGSSSSKEETIREIDFSVKKIEISKEETINFKINEESHSIYLNDFSSSGANITLSSTPINFFLKFLEVKTFDLDENEIDDISLSLDSVYTDFVVLNIENLELETSSSSEDFFREETSENSNVETQNENNYFENNANSNSNNLENQNNFNNQKEINNLEESIEQENSQNIFLYVIFGILFCFLVSLIIFCYFKFNRKKEFLLYSYDDFQIYKYIEKEEGELFTDKSIKKVLENSGVKEERFFKIKNLVENNYFHYIKNKKEWEVYEYIINSLNKGKKGIEIINKLEVSNWDKFWVQNIISKIIKTKKNLNQ